MSNSSQISDLRLTPTRRVRALVQGVVQGVGFRPHVHRLAVSLGLSGQVRNEPAGVWLEVEGPSAKVDAFFVRLKEEAPPLAHILRIDIEEIAPSGRVGFLIEVSSAAGGRSVLIAPDVATCAACLVELRDPADRRYRYPFINCTHCGPRYTIIRDVPYDRANTTMAPFEMCEACRLEYENPSDRRFHAEPTCCPVCGPRVWLTDAHGAEISTHDPLRETAALLRSGAVLAIKGLGGFHLACDATNPEAVALLRRRKQRDCKPFALMLPGLDVAEHIACVTEQDARHLASPERPILLLPKRPGHDLADGIAPGSAEFGLMLPYTPLHHLLLDHAAVPLVMTSGNLSQEPIAHANDEALARLASVADAFLLHDRGIHIRTDDSVARMVAGAPAFLRRSRGYAPFPVELPCDTEAGEVLAVGAELNNAICLTRGGMAFLSHHIGDLENVPAYEAYLQAIEHLSRLLDVRPVCVAHDLHPAYLSTRHARDLGLPVIAVQHHHAHIASVLAEYNHTEPVIGVAFDGVGWGADGLPWGGEFLVCDLSTFQRVGCLEPVAQPGGDAAAKHPAHMAFAYLWETFGADCAISMACELMPKEDPGLWATLDRMIERRVNSPLTTSAGRLFDAAAALLGVCQKNTYHAQAPAELEALAWQAPEEEGHYPAVVLPGPDRLLASGTAIIRALVDDRASGTEPARSAARFHHALARLALDMCRQIRENTTIATVALSGGVFANAFLTGRLVSLLEQDGFTVLLNRKAPSGDGGVALGQAAVAVWLRSHTG